MFFKYAGPPSFNHSLLTYMSTHAILKASIQKGLLCYVTPSFDDPVIRPMLMHREMAALFEAHHGLRAIGAMRGYLESIITGVHVTMAFEPYNHRDATMGQMDPIHDGTWEIRCRDPSPATRVFGRFLCQNVFVALEWAPRSKRVAGIDREPLGDTDSLEWHIALGETEKRWNAIAPGIEPLIGSQVSEYFAENANEVRD